MNKARLYLRSSDARLFLFVYFPPPLSRCPISSMFEFWKRGRGAQNSSLVIIQGLLRFKRLKFYLVCMTSLFTLVPYYPPWDRSKKSVYQATLLWSLYVWSSEKNFSETSSTFERHFKDQLGPRDTSQCMEWCFGELVEGLPVGLFSLRY